MRRQEEKLSREEKRDLGEDDAAALSATLCRLRRGDGIKATYYDGARYREIKGVVTAFDEIKRTLTVEETVIAFEDLSALSIV